MAGLSHHQTEDCAGRAFDLRMPYTGHIEDLRSREGRRVAFGLAIVVPQSDVATVYLLWELHWLGRSATNIKREQITELQCLHQAVQRLFWLYDLLEQTLLAHRFFFPVTLHHHICPGMVFRDAYKVLAHDVSADWTYFLRGMDRA